MKSKKYEEEVSCCYVFGLTKVKGRKKTSENKMKAKQVKMEGNCYR